MHQHPQHLCYATPSSHEYDGLIVTSNSNLSQQENHPKTKKVKFQASLDGCIWALRNLTKPSNLLSVDHPSAIRTGANPSVWADPLGQRPLRNFSCTTWCVRYQNAPLGGMLFAHMFFLSVYSQLFTHVICQLLRAYNTQ